MAHIKISHFSAEEKEFMKKNFSSWQIGEEYVKVEPGYCTLPIVYKELKDVYYDWPLDCEDVFVFGWVKTGTTWTREMVWCILNDVNIKAAKETLLNVRIPFIDMPMLAAFDDNCEKELGLPPIGVIKRIQSLPSPKILKSHMPFEILPSDLLDKCKVIMCLRNPKDVLVSYYHHNKMLKMHGFIGDFATFFDIFMRGLTIYGDYFEYAATAWEKRGHPNMCILFYEDMKQDISLAIQKVAKFLRKEITDEQLEILANHIGFKEMKKNNAVNNEAIREVAFVNKNEGSFIRKGEVGDWKNYFTDEMNKQMNEAIDKYFKPIGLEFRYE